MASYNLIYACKVRRNHRALWKCKSKSTYQTERRHISKCYNCQLNFCSSRTAPSAALMQCLSVAEVCSPDGPFRRCYLHGTLSELGLLFILPPFGSVVFDFAFKYQRKKTKVERKVTGCWGRGGVWRIVTNWTFITILVTAFHPQPLTEGPKKIIHSKFQLK